LKADRYRWYSYGREAASDERGVLTLLHEKVDQTLFRLKEACLAVYGSRLVSLVVFGSVGRGTPRFDSDIDLLLVADDLPRGRLKRVHEFARVEEKLCPWFEELSALGLDFSLSPVFKTPAEVEAGSLLFLDMIDDRRILYDRKDFFASYLERLARRLRELGAYKVQEGSRWHWVLKPDYRPGEVFEI